jgi:hypothetical protein
MSFSDLPAVWSEIAVSDLRYSADVRTLADTNARWAGDDGTPDPQLRRALEQAQPGEHQTDDPSAPRQRYLDAVVALGAARLLVPVVATGDDAGDGPDPTRQAEISAVWLELPDGSRALPVFTGLDALQAWNTQARPVPGTLDEVALTAAEVGAELLVVDVAGPSPLELGPDLVTQLGAGRRLVALGDGGYGWASVSSRID